MSYLYPYEAGSGVWGQVAQDMVVYFTSIEMSLFFNSDGCHSYPALMACIVMQK